MRRGPSSFGTAQSGVEPIGIMSEQEEQSKGFKVTDRRSFTREGERITSSEPEGDVEEKRASFVPESPAPEPEELPRMNALGRHEVRFYDLLSLLATQASLALGAPHPSGESHEDLETARIMISMIEVLKEKSTGNLTRDEQAALDEILYQLRMEFVAKAKVNKN
jgi:hypothetical protein